MTSAEAAVHVENLSYRLPAGRARPERMIIDGLSFEAARGETFGLLGPNGSGKTTLFRILTTLLPPSAGRASILGLDVRAEAALVKPLIGVVFQQPSLDAKLTVRENMTHQGRLYGLSGAELARRSGALLERYGLADRAADVVSTLSGGLKRRLEIAKSLLHDPRLLILDEPSTGLDPGARKALWEHLAELKAGRGLTLVTTTHLMDEAEHCDRLVIIDQGRLAAAGAPQALKSEIGGDVISIETPDPAALRAAIKERFGVEPAAVDGALRLERPQGHSFIPALIEAFPGSISSVSLGKPTLEDVFVRHTGRRFASDAAREKA